MNLQTSSPSQLNGWPVMHSSFRAGLPTLALLLALFVASLSAVPVPASNLQTRYIHDDTPSLLQRAHSAVVPVDRSTLGQFQNVPETVLEQSISTKSKHPSEKMHTLVRRKGIGAKIKAAFKKFGHKVKSGFKKMGQGIKKVAQKVGHGIKKVAQKVGKGIKTAAKKVGHFVKTTGAKIAKFGLKIASTVQSVAAKVVGFIPGIGKPISKALSASSKGLSIASDRIPVKLSSKLEKGMKVMDKIRNPVGGAGGKVLNAILRRDSEDEDLMQRDFVDVEERDFDLEERDLAEFEERGAELEERVFVDFEERDEGEEALYMRSWDEWDDLN